MASGQDPLADMQNLIGYQGLVGDNPYIVQPGQLQPFGSPAGMGMGFGQMAAGIPTDAHGNPIGGAPAQSIQAPAAGPQQSTPGTTINSVPQGGPPSQGGTINYAGMGPAGSAVQELMNNYQAAQAAMSPQQQYNQQQANAVRQQMLQQQDNITASANAGGGFGQSPGGAFNPGPSYSPNPFQSMATQPAAAAPAAAASAPAGALSRTQYLSLLANPGKPTAYGAAPPGPGQTPTGAMGPNVTNAFLAANAGSNTPYVKTLRNVQGGTA